MNTQALQNLNVESWTYLLRRDPQIMEATVVDVATMPLSSTVNRYLLTLAGSPEPISLIGKETNISEVRFYQQLAGQTPQIVPHCWFTDLHDQTGWVVLDDVENYHRPRTWNREDVEGIVQHLATMHGTFWEIDVTKPDVLPTFLGRSQALRRSQQGQRRNYSNMRLQSLHENGHALFESLHLQAGKQSGRLRRAYASYQTLQRLSGWIGVASKLHLDAIGHLLSEPSVMLTPLQTLPYTLLHSRPGVENWQISLFNGHTLLDWHTAALGPGICDLVYFIEDLLAFRSAHQAAETEPEDFAAEWSLVEETLVDTYFIRLSHELSALDPAYRYSSRQVRRWALPAAYCLHFLTHSLPRITSRLLTYSAENASVESLKNTDESIERTNCAEPVQVGSQVGQLFERFINAYKLLTT